MQFLGIAQPKSNLLSQGLPEDFHEVVAREQIRVRALYSEGSLRQIWQKGGGRGAVAIFEVETLESMESLISSFPLVQAGYIEYQLIPLEPYSGFGRVA